MEKNKVYSEMTDEEIRAVVEKIFHEKISIYFKSAEEANSALEAAIKKELGYEKTIRVVSALVFFSKNTSRYFMAKLLSPRGEELTIL